MAHKAECEVQTLMCDTTAVLNGNAHCRVFQPTKNAMVDTVRIVITDAKWFLLLLVSCIPQRHGGFIIRISLPLIAQVLTSVLHTAYANSSTLNVTGNLDALSAHVHVSTCMQC